MDNNNSLDSNNNSIDSKKNDKNANKYSNFAKNYLYSLLFTIIVCIFLFGSFGLYISKLTQTNILGDDINLAPFTNFDRNVAETIVDINIVKPNIFSGAESILSEKATFDKYSYFNYYSYSIHTKLKEYANPDSGFFANFALYLSSVYDNVLSKHNTALNTIYGVFNHIPEEITMIITGLFGVVFFCGIYFFNVMTGIFFHVMNIPQLFRRQFSYDSNKWEAFTDIQIGLFKLIPFCLVWLPLGCISAFLSPLIITISGFLAPLYTKFKYQNTTTSETDTSNTYGIFDFIKNIFYFKQHFLMMLASISLIYNGNKFLGTKSLIPITIGILISYFLGWYTPITNTEINTKLTTGLSNKDLKLKEVTKGEQLSTKVLKVTEIPISNPLIKRGGRHKQTYVKLEGGNTVEGEYYGKPIEQKYNIHI